MIAQIKRPSETTDERHPEWLSESSLRRERSVQGGLRKPRVSGGTYINGESGRLRTEFYSAQHQQQSEASSSRTNDFLACSHG
jgi:hypothetical protein